MAPVRSTGLHSARNLTAFRGPIAIAVALALVLVLIPRSLNAFEVGVLVVVLWNIALALGFRLLLITGLANLAHVSFFAIGAYVSALLLVKEGWPFVLSMPAGGLAAAGVAGIIGYPILRTRGVFFFLVTFALFVVVNEIFRVWRGVTGGVFGVTGIPSIPGAADFLGSYYFFLILTSVVVVIMALLERSRFGRELHAIGTSERLSESIGIDTVGQRFRALVIGALIAGLAGAAYASNIQFVGPNSFSFLLAINVLLYTVLGGPRYWWGPIIGTVFAIIVPEFLRFSPSLTAILTSFVVLFVIMVAPQGIAGVLVDHKGTIGRLTQAGRLRRGAGRWVAQRSTHAAASLPMGSPGPEAGAPGESGGEAASSDAALRTPIAEAVPAPPGKAEPPEASEPIFVVDSVTMRFGGIAALDNVSLSVAAGEVVGVIGPNGAGKSTLFNVVTGFLVPTSGRCLFAGQDITAKTPHVISRLGITRTFQIAEVFPQLSPADNLRLPVQRRSGNGQRQGALLGAGGSETDQITTLLALANLTKYADVPAGVLPPGQQKMLGVAMALATNPLLLCLDEPTAGLHEAEAAEIEQLVRAVNSAGVTVLLVEHRVPFVKRLCGRIIVLDLGRKIADGAARDVVVDRAVVEAYLGGSSQE